MGSITLAGLAISGPWPLTTTLSEQGGRIGRCPICGCGLFTTLSFLLLEYGVRGLKLGQVFHQIFQVVRLIHALHQIVLNSDRTPLAPLLLALAHPNGHFKQLPCVVLKKP